MDKHRISIGQVSNILKRKEDIINASYVNSKLSRHRFNIRQSIFKNINILTFEFFCQCRSKNIPISGPLLKEKALYFSKELKTDNFTASDGWLDCLKKRHNINHRTISGESAPVSIELASNRSEEHTSELQSPT